jgi:hypothetical protein
MARIADILPNADASISVAISQKGATQLLVFVESVGDDLR